MSIVSENELFKRFVKKLEESKLTDERRRKIRDLVIDGMMEALHAN